jgi:hypothetical protein
MEQAKTNNWDEIVATLPTIRDEPRKARAAFCRAQAPPEMRQPTMASFSLSPKQKAVACAVGIIPVTIAGFVLLRYGCAFAAFGIEIGVGLFYFVWVLL